MLEGCGETDRTLCNRRQVLVDNVDMVELLEYTR